MAKISVIIPVYNTQKYIEKCLNSLKEQTYKDIEVIVVNDGSTDYSEEIIMKWMEENNDIAIKYYKKKNGGLSSARNYGIEMASGEYLMFLDSDDYIDINLFKNLEQYMNKKIDIIKYKMIMVNEKNSEKHQIQGPVFDICTGEEAFKKLVGQDSFLEVSCIYLFRTQFFVDKNFRFNEINKFHEDFGLIPLVIVNAKTFLSSEVYGYMYNQTDNSIMRNNDYEKKIKKANDVLGHYDNMLTSIETYDISDETKELIKKYYTNTVILKAKELKKVERKKYFKEIRNRKMYKNIKPVNIKQTVKRILLFFSLNLYLKMR